MILPLTEPAYEPIRSALFEQVGSGSASETKQRLAEAIAADPIGLVMWMVDAGIVHHAVFTTGSRRLTVTTHAEQRRQAEEAGQ